MRASLANILTIARREFLFRGRGKTYVVSTVILVVVAIGVAVAPDRRALLLAERRARADRPVGREHAPGGRPRDRPRPRPQRGRHRPGRRRTEQAVLRDRAGDRCRGRSAGRRRRQAVGPARGRARGLGRPGVHPVHETRRLRADAADPAPGRRRRSRSRTASTVSGSPRPTRSRSSPRPPFAIRAADPATTGGPDGPDTITDFVGDYVVGFALTIFIFMAIMLYGQWVAMSVAEEKNSRVMELILGAREPVPAPGRQGPRRRGAGAAPVRDRVRPGQPRDRLPGPDRRASSWAAPHRATSRPA